MNVLLVTSWDTPQGCGIEQHSRMLIDAVGQADGSITVTPNAAALNPNANWGVTQPFDLIHLNYQASLHSRWTAKVIRECMWSGEAPVLVTYHDTGVPNSDHCKAIHAAASAMVIHEPADDLPGAHYWRMGVPTRGGALEHHPDRFAWPGQPLLGSLGFPFPWKCYDELARVTAKAGWALLLIAPGATDEQIATWRAINPHFLVETDFLHRQDALVRLAACDATAFTYVCHNTGQSGAILQGIATRKPVIALSTCRQMRALYDDELGRRAICWAETFEDVAHYLSSRTFHIGRVDPGIVALAEQESWTRLGKQYADLYRGLVA